MPYRELVQRESQKDTLRATATRVFIDDPGGSVADLPSYGSAIDANNPFCVVTNIHEAQYGGLTTTKIYTVQYTTERRSSTPTIIGGNKNLDNLPTYMQFGVEAMVLDPAESGTQLENPQFKWAESVGGVDKVYQPVFQMIPTGSFTCQQKVSDLSGFNTAALAILGKVNSSTFKGFPAECVMYAGHTADEQIGTEGSTDRGWLVVMQFQWRLIPMPTGSSIDYGGWNHFWRRDYDSGGTPNDIGWQKILYRHGSSAIYGTADFSSLIQT